MIITLNDTTTREVSKALLDSQENYSLATGRVLTLIVVASVDDDLDAMAEADGGEE